MSEISVLILLYVFGVLMLIAEIFIPSQGVLSIAAIGFLVTAVVKTFAYGGREAGVIALLACLVFLPVLGYLSIKYWRKTPIGRRIVPPNPEMTPETTAHRVEELSPLIGRTGRTVSPLRPVGICDFDGKRISCIAEFGMLDADAEVVGAGIQSGNLTVREKKA